MRGGRGGWDGEGRTETGRDGWGWGGGVVHVETRGKFEALGVSLTGRDSWKRFWKQERLQHESNFDFLLSLSHLKKWRADGV